MAGSDAGTKPVWLFYFIQNERGEDALHPNAVKLWPNPAVSANATAPPAKITLRDVQAAFPLSGTGAYHFRFQAVSDKTTVFVDALSGDDAVPTLGGNVIAKVLRLGACRLAGVSMRSEA
jgi:hypothetical protein